MNKIVKYTVYYAVIALLTFAVSYLLAYRYFTSQVYDQSLNQLELYSKTFRSQLYQLRPLNKILSHHPVVFNSLLNPNDEGSINEINNILVKSRNIAGAAQIYLLDASGMTIASSNWQEKNSFVGNNYGFRPYFEQAIKGLSGQFYAVGIRSNIRGYYFSEPIYKNGEIIGVIVLKVAIDKLEETIKDTDQKLMILDNFGIVFLSNEPSDLYKMTKHLPEKDLQFINQIKRYNNEQLGYLKFTKLSNFHQNHIIELGNKPRSKKYIRIDLVIPIIGWKIVNLIDEIKVLTPSIITSIIVTILTLSSMFLVFSVRSRQKIRAEHLAFKNQQAIELERRVDARSRELKQAQDDLVQTAKLAALGQMSAAISHELSQPLTAISNYIQNAKAYLVKKEYGNLSQNVDYIGSLSDKMTAIIHHIKIFASKRPSEINRISINKVIEETVWFMQSKFLRRDVQLEISLPHDDVFILANSVRIEQVLMNLISNALESMQLSQVKILNIEMTFNDDLAKIIIRDTGEGISEQSIETIFKPFYTTKEDENGMGIGLSISRSIIEEYDGILEAFNRPSGGARFEISLPISNE